MVGTAVAAASAFFVSRAMTPIYRAQSTLLINLAQQPAAPTYQDVTTSQALTKTYAQLITSRPVLEEAARQLGGGVTAERLTGVSGSVVQDTELLHVSFEDRDPAFAAQVVNAVSQVFAKRVRDAQLGQTSSAATTATPTSINTVFIAEPADIPHVPVSPKTSQNTALGAIAGFLLAAGLVALLEYLNDTVKDREDLAKLELPSMGVVRRGRRKGGPSLLDPAAARGALAEDYRQLRTNIEFASRAGEVRSLVVTSARSGEGKTTTACNLALVLAAAGRRVALVDGDLRRPGVHRFFGLPNQSGLTTAFLSGLEALDGLLRVGPQENLLILTTGPIPPNPAELLAGPGMSAIMERLRSLADIVVVDSPPVLGLADASLLAAGADAALLVVDARRTRAGAVHLAVDTLRHSGVRIVGATLNRVTSEGVGYGYYYVYGSGDDESQFATAETGSESNGRRRGGAVAGTSRAPTRGERG